MSNFTTDYGNYTTDNDVSRGGLIKTYTSDEAKVYNKKI